MSSYYDVEKAKKHVLDSSEIGEQNKQWIVGFVDDASANDLSVRRQVKYAYVCLGLARMLGKDFKSACKADIKSLCASINRHEQWSEWTKHDYKVILKILYRWLRSEEGMVFDRGEYPSEVSWLRISNPGGKKKKLPRDLLTVDDAKALADAAENLRDRALILFLYESGCRVGELMELRLRDLESDRYGMKAILPDSGKTGARFTRLIASGPAISNWLLEHPAREKRDAPVFCRINNPGRGETLGYRSVNKLLKQVAKRAGVSKPVNPHHFRHSRATELAYRFTEVQMCNYFGWVIGSNEASTYVHTSGKNLDDAVLAMYGLKRQDDSVERFSPIVCPRCQSKNDPSMKFCGQCSMGLDEKSLLEFEEKKEVSARVGMEVLNEKNVDVVLDVLLKRLEERQRKDEK